MRLVGAFFVMAPRDKLQAAGHEMKMNPPRILAKTRRKFGKRRAEKQRVAILMSKAGMSRRKG